MEIITDTTQADFETKRNLVSLIYLKIDEVTFPDSGWTDFLVIILDWWIQEFLNQLSGKKNGRYEFMDGPFFFEISIQNSGNLLLTGFEESVNSSKQVFQANVRVQEFLLALKITSNQILRMCHKMEYSTPDVKSLEKSFKKIQDISLNTN